MRGAARLALLPVLAFAALGCGLGGGAAPPAQPSFVLLSIDTLRRDHLRPFDSQAPELPVLEHLASRGARFQDAISTASWTLPAHASLLTGLLPSRHGATRPDRALARGVFHLAHALDDAGYRTVALVGSGYLAPTYGLGRGFHLYSAGPERRGPASRNVAGDPWEEVFVRAEAFLKSRRPGGQPFLLLAQTYRLHDYFHVKDETVAALDLEPPELEREEALACMVGERDCTPESSALLETLYAQELRFVDRAVGELLGVLEATGLADSTYVFLLSDHGEGFDPARRRLSHGGRLHEDVIRIPFVVAGPGVAPGDRHVPASLVDVAPTVLELAGIEVPPGLDGVSLAPVLRDPEAGLGPGRTRVAQQHGFVFEEDGRRRAEVGDESALGVAVLRDDLWYIAGPDGEALYDMARDPEQRRDRSDAAPPALAGLRRDAEAHRALDTRPRVVRPAGPALRRQLEALGYVR